MGKLTLLLVLAAVLGASALTLSTRTTAGHAARGQAEGQADLLARQIAESGQSVVLSQMMDIDGFKDPGITSQAYDDGRFDVTYVPAADRQTATVTVKGYYGGAVHTIESAYEFDPMNYPGPVWLDVPYATSQISGTPSVSGGPDALKVEFDPRRHAGLGLQSVLPLNGVTVDFRPDMQTAGSDFPTPSAGRWTGASGLLADLNVNDAEDLYQVALAALGPADRSYPGAQTLSTPLVAMGPTTITRVGGTLTLDAGANVTGEGVLLVEGGLVVKPGARLTWTGLVIVRSTDESLPIQLDGAVTVTGGLVVAQDAYPPGGHLDVTVFQDRTGLSQPPGDTNGSWAAPGTGPFPWYEHIHQFEQNVSATRQVIFAQQGSDPQEAHLKFREALAAAGSNEVYLEFENEQVHGHARYRLDAQGLASVATGTVRNGFADGLRQAGQPHRSARFRADQLRDFALDVRSLRALKQRFDGSGCQVWPFCIGERWDRGGALRVRLRRASGRVLYEAALYWHMREDEEAQHLADEQAWRSQVASGVGFGAHLRMGDQATVAFALAPIVRLRERLGFDGNQVNLLSSTTSHQTTRDSRAAVPPVPTSTPATTPGL